MNNTIKWIIGIIIVITIIWFGFLKSDEPISNEPIKIGVIAPLTGKAANFGEDAQNAINMAVDEINSENQQRVKVVYQDSECDPKKAVSAYNYLRDVENIKTIIGPCCSSATLAVAPLAEKNSVVIITPMSSAETISNMGDFIFRNHTHDKSEMISLVPYVLENYKNVAILYDSTNDGIIQQEKWFTEIFEAGGGKIVSSISMIGGGGDYRSELLKIKSNIDNIDVIFLPLIEKDAIIVIKQMDELGISKDIIGNKGFATSNFVDSVGLNLSNNVVYAEAVYDRNSNLDFWDKYVSIYERNPAIWSAQSYDIVKFLVGIFNSTCKTNDSVCVKDELYKIDYQGIAGRVKFDENGDAVKDIAIKQIQNGKFVRVK